MKGEKVRVIFIYILVAVIILLVGYLIYNFLMNTNNSKDQIETKTDNTISDNCTFDINNADYGTIVNGETSTLCGGLNKLKINDMILDSNELKIEVYYYNGSIDENDNSTGVYIDGKRVVRYASTDYKNNFGIFDNKLFIFSVNPSNLNVVAYDSSINRVYDLKTSLLQSNISDPAFVELAKTDSTLNTIVNNANIDSSSFNFGPNEFLFSTDTKKECQVGTNIGSTYKVTFSGNTFSAPQFVGYNACNR